MVASGGIEIDRRLIEIDAELRDHEEQIVQIESGGVDRALMDGRLREIEAEMAALAKEIEESMAA